MTLKEFNGKEIESFNNDEAEVTYTPDTNCKFVLQYEEYCGEYSHYDKFFILHLDDDNNEIERWNALSPVISFIRWA